jgi:hypothetical protein
MIKKLVKHGNSQCIVIDKAILDLLNWTSETRLEITTDGDKLFVRPLPALTQYPTWTCGECAVAYGGWMKETQYATFHEGTCDSCGKTKTVTEPRDYHYPKYPVVK